MVRAPERHTSTHSTGSASISDAYELDLYPIPPSSPSGPNTSLNDHTSMRERERESTGSLDTIGLNIDDKRPWLSRLFDDAKEFEEVLVEEPEVEHDLDNDLDNDNDDENDLELIVPSPSSGLKPLDTTPPNPNQNNTLLHPPTPKYTRARGYTSVSVTDLVGRDLALTSPALFSSPLPLSPSLSPSQKRTPIRPNLTLSKSGSRFHELGLRSSDNVFLPTSTSTSTSPLISISSGIAYPPFVSPHNALGLEDSYQSSHNGSEVDLALSNVEEDVELKLKAEVEVPHPLIPPPRTDIESTEAEGEGYPGELPQLTPEEKIKIFEDELGVLARKGEGEEERIILETDGAFWLEVVILGVVHLTTHRLAFHASLLSPSSSSSSHQTSSTSTPSPHSSRHSSPRSDHPSLHTSSTSSSQSQSQSPSSSPPTQTPMPTQQILRSGPATYHRPNPYRKRKVWLELAQDMLSTFRSSGEGERVRPMKTIPLSDVIRIWKPQLPGSRRARSIRLDLKSKSISSGSSSSSPTAPSSTSTPSLGPTLSFDTEEAASEWFNDIQAALFLYKRNRNSVMSGDSLEGVEDGGGGSISAGNEHDGVRISVPLERITSVTVGPVLKSYPSSLSSSPLDGTPTAYKIELQWSGLSHEEDLSFVIHGDTHQKFEFLERLSHFRRVRSVEAQARALQLHKEGGRLVDIGAGTDERLENVAPIIVDFGSLASVEDEFEGARDKNVYSASRSERSLKRLFGIPPAEHLWISRSRLAQGLHTTGLFAISSRFIIFWAKYRAFSDVKYRFPASKFQHAVPIRLFRGYGMQLDIEGQESLSFAFDTAAKRDEAIHALGELHSSLRTLSSSSSGILSGSVSPPITPLPSQTFNTNGTVTRSTSLRSTDLSSPPARSGSPAFARSTTVISPLSRACSFAKSAEFPPGFLPHLPKVINLPHGLQAHISPRHFVCLTIGSRGDVQPYIALGRGLMKDGHRVTIVTHAEYKKWIEGWGIAHRTAGGDPGALMKLSVEHKMFSPAFFRESLGHFRTWLDDLLRDAWEQCRDADVLIESPSAMAGVHIAEALDIPYFRAFTMPWSKTSEYPHAFISPPVDAPAFNSGTYVLFDNVLWVATSGQINRWRRKVLGLGNTDMSHMAQNKIPFLYNFSTAVVPKPLDWRDDISISGYWFLDNPDHSWTPPADLLAFMASARKDGKPLVYIGFGSITVPRPAQMSRSIVKAVLKSDVRAIISKGWSSRMAKEEAPEIVYPKECYIIDSIPHDWLFPKIDAALHHGGAGTTGASLRAGIPTLIKPWFGDQFFWASRVQKLGAGLRVPSLRSSALAEALRHATSDRVMKEKAAGVGQRIRGEDGVRTAIHAIYTYLPRARRPKNEA